ncbi:MAG: hypothetical protein ACOYNP_19595 [Gemmataceae bacterium]
MIFEINDAFANPVGAALMAVDVFSCSCMRFAEQETMKVMALRMNRRVNGATCRRLASSNEWPGHNRSAYSTLRRDLSWLKSPIGWAWTEGLQEWPWACRCPAGGRPYSVPPGGRGGLFK